ELLDDYLSNRLKGNERIEFERRLESDASLQSELALQRELIEGIRSARVAELKSMLNQVPVPPASGGSIACKFVAWALAVVVVGLGAYSLCKSSPSDETASTETSEGQADEPAVTNEPAIEEQSGDETNTAAAAEEDTETSVAGDAATPAEQPAAKQDT